MMHRSVVLVFAILGALSWAYVIQLSWLKINHHTFQEYRHD